MDNDSITLWRISFDTASPPVREYIPRVPSTTMDGEDTDTPRICFAESIELCVSAIPGDRRREGFEEGRQMMVFPFQVCKYDPFLVIPERLDREGLVPDAICTREYWYLRPVVLRGELVTIGSFAWGNYYFASERHRQQVYAALVRRGIPESSLTEFDGVPVFDLVNNILNNEPRFWEFDQCFGDLIAEDVGIPNSLLFDYLELLPAP